MCPPDSVDEMIMKCFPPLQNERGGQASISIIDECCERTEMDPILALLCGGGGGGADCGSSCRAARQALEGV